MKTSLIKRLVCTVALLLCLSFVGAYAQTAAGVSVQEARAIAKDAYVYGFPLVDGYRILHAYFVDRDNPEYKAPWNQIKNIPRVYTPDDKAVQTPNSDTPYSFLGMDLRAEPIVLTVPPIEKDRYFSIQLVDLYTHNFDYIGSRATGNGGGSFLIAGPGWNGEVPAGVTKVMRSETELALAIYRTQLFNPGDLDKVKAIQTGYKAQPLSTFLGQSGPKTAPAIDFIKPLTPETQKTSPEFFNVLNFVLKFCPTVPSEKELMARFAGIGVGAGKSIDTSKLSPEIKAAIEQGMADAWTEMAKLKKRFDAGEVKSGDVFGTREYLKNNYLYRMTAAALGIYGNSKQEAMYPLYAVDADGQKLDGAKSRYTLRFAPGQLPPVSAFWSLTMYELPSSLLVANPLNRYLLNSPMLPQFKKDADGGLTLLIQNESPGVDKESNWLPAPKGPFFMAMRLYWPKAEATEGKWTPPVLNAVAEVEYGLDGVVKNGTVETRIGELTFENGYPSRKSLEHLFDTMDFQRACQAYIWALPMVAMAEWQDVHEKQFHAKDRAIVVYQTTEEKLGILTANATTPYVIAFNDLGRSGPLVIDVPAGPTGGLVNDFWQRPVVDLGLAGPDKGKGGKYLILGPGQEKPEGIETDYIYESGTMNILYGIRILTPDPKESKRLLDSFRSYPVSNLKENQKYASVKGEWFQYHPRGLGYWERLHAICQREPVAERDRFMLASLRFLGIEKGKPFQPGARQKEILEEATLVGEAMAQANSFESRFPGVKYRDDAGWEYVIFLDPSQRVGEHEQLDERAAYAYEAVTTSAGMTTKTPGVGSAYLGGYRDSDGDWLDGSRNYRLTIPPNAPMKQFWSITVYSQATRCLINNGTGRADRSSRHDLVKNADGSVDVCFGPGEAPEGMENNFVKTVKGEGFFVYLRLYAPTEPYFERSWALPDIEKVK